MQARNIAGAVALGAGSLLGLSAVGDITNDNVITTACQATAGTGLLGLGAYALSKGRSGAIKASAGAAAIGLGGLWIF